MGLQLSYSHPPLPSSAVDWNTNSLTTTTVLKISRCRVWNVFGAPHITQSSNNCYYLTCLAAPWNSPIYHTCLYLMIQSSLRWKSPIPRVFVKNNQQQLFNTAAILSSDISWDKQEIGQKLKEILDKWAIHRGLWKTTHLFWGSTNQCKCVGLYEWPENIWKHSKLSPQTDLSFHFLLV